MFSSRLFSNGQPGSPGPVFWRREVRLSGRIVGSKVPLSPCPCSVLARPPPRRVFVFLTLLRISVSHVLHDFASLPARKEGEASGETSFVQSEADRPVLPPLRLEALPLTLAMGRGEQSGSSSCADTGTPGGPPCEKASDRLLRPRHVVQRPDQFASENKVINIDSAVCGGTRVPARLCSVTPAPLPHSPSPPKPPSFSVSALRSLTVPVLSFRQGQDRRPKSEGHGSVVRRL